MTFTIRHVVVIWVIVMPLMTVVPYGLRTTHPNTTFAGFPFETLNWRQGQLTRVSIAALIANVLSWTMPFACVTAVMHIRGKKEA